MLKNAVLLGLLATLCLGLSGCGQKGDLYARASFGFCRSLTVGHLHRILSYPLKVHDLQQ